MTLDFLLYVLVAILSILFGVSAGKLPETYEKLRTVTSILSFIALVIVFAAVIKYSITPTCMDMLRNKTDMIITYTNNMPQDTVIVFKNKL